MKYDEIIVCQIGLPEKESMINYEDLNILTSITKVKLEEVLEGIGLKQKNIESSSSNRFQMKEDPFAIDNDNRLNQIIHINTVD